LPEDQATSKVVLVLGVGPTPPENPPRLHAPGLRLWSLARFLVAQGYDVVIGMVGFAGDREDSSSTPVTESNDTLFPESLPYGITCYRLPYRLEEAARRVRVIARRHHPRCVVSTTDFMNLVAVSAALPVPLWLDYMGQPMTERQLLADVYESDEGLRGQWEYVLPSLLGGDHFSVCSNRQRYILLGELGAVGRLNRHTAREDLVDVLVPFHLFDVKFRHSRDVLRSVCVRADDFVVLWSGGYNTWTDVDTLFKGLESAMAQHPSIVFVSTGGAIPGHDNRTYERFRQWVENSPNKHRYKLCGWVPTEDVQNYYLESNAALNVDRWSVEGQVGYRTRILDWIIAGLPVVTTVLCELTEELASHNFVTTFRIGDPQDLGIKLAALAVDCSTAMVRTAKAQEYLRTQLDPTTALAPLAKWVADPQPAPDLPPPDQRPGSPLWCPENSLARLHRGTLTSPARGKRF
jgi:glycosyltransferase involved in cell wall biosynthesis